MIQFLLGFLVVLFLWIVSTYNGLITLHNRVKEAWSDIDVQLRRRYNLIPNLVETVKGYATHEKGVFEKVSEARSMAMGAQGLKEKGEAENMLSGTLKSLIAVSESYPELKASANFVELQRELRDTEDKIQSARRFYNGNVRDWNTKVETFPTKLIASTMDFNKEEFFGTESEAERQVPEVKF
ncbi:MAG: LemA family protein [Patescibacteria group bacterium]